MTNLAIELYGESVVLLPERALFHPATYTLFIADLHLGKADTFRTHRIPLPDGSTQADLLRLSRAIARMDARRLIILGDLIHAKQGRDLLMLETFQSWRAHHQALEIMLVRGNHDKGAGDPPDEWNILNVNPPYEETPFVLAHQPEEADKGYVLAGHLHPAVMLEGKARQRLKLPCFLFGRRVGVLPAFTSLAASAVISPKSGDRIYVITDSAVIAIN
jgi:uncharacterized protein